MEKNKSAWPFNHNKSDASYQIPIVNSGSTKWDIALESKS